MKRFNQNLKGLKSCLLAAIFIFSGNMLFAQQPKQKNETNRPQIHTNVKIKRDKNGNITSYDSTYSYYYRSDGNYAGNQPQLSDSLPQKFQKAFSENQFFNSDNFFNGNFFPGDSLFQSFNANFPSFGKMDSLMQHFFSNMPYQRTITQPKEAPQQQKVQPKIKKSQPAFKEDNNDPNAQIYHL